MHSWLILARLVYPHNPGLAAELAAYAGETLLGLGIEAPPVPPPPPPRDTKATDLVDILVLAAMVESGGTAHDVRRWLHAALKRACDVGLSLAEAERALRPVAAISPDPPAT
jgi:hypothetical protein